MTKTFFYSYKKDNSKNLKILSIIGLSIFIINLLYIIRSILDFNDKSLKFILVMPAILLGIILIKTISLIKNSKQADLTLEDSKIILNSMFLKKQYSLSLKDIKNIDINIVDEIITLQLSNASHIIKLSSFMKKDRPKIIDTFKQLKSNLA
ncbi:hypothetical protein [Hathewaya limosa]|uniref:Uncharacterized protein n=1 Tax=Hathewaya limosa TaxID=1536 RepID=A0ABU0JS33_HATLI|nr:hypothetical protein [Hathewaya limosa]AWZ49010.1 hypothetical protein C3495_09390 [Clostridiaceae bacterium 14S0207]MDQ0479878.1 hypothetical protein [Hathewaya limosa]